MNPHCFIKPHYNQSGFASIPNQVRELFAQQAYDTVILFLIDSFGWRFFEKFQDEPFLCQLARHGQVQKITSQFPSTTAAHITSLHTSQEVGQHGVYEWFYYEPSVDVMIAPLLFSRAGDLQRDTLKPLYAQPTRLYPTKTLFHDLLRLGVEAHIFQHREYTPSTYSDAIYRGAKARPYRTLPETLVNVGLRLEKQQKPTYIVCYFDRVDGLSHEYGPGSPQVEAEIIILLHTLEKIFLPSLLKGRGRTLFLLTADHGQTETDPATTVFLNQAANLKGIERFLKTNRAGELLVPAGSCRDMFLYINDGLLDEAQAFLARGLEGKADVVRVQTLIEQGYFGAQPVSDTFKSRVADLVILPYPGESVWWYEKDRFEQRYYGHHGGLTPAEMEIPLIQYEVQA
jgi:predicted AlkP superfamily pyrophosphatase or phosphodiesterase